MDLALSLRDVTRDPIALILGDELRDAATARQLAVFDHVLPLPPGFPRNIGKLAAPQASPFERTLFADADCLALGGFEDVWQRLEPLQFALQGEVLTPADDVMHGLRSTAETMRRFGISRYVKSNSGLFYFRKAAGIAVAEACMKLYREAFASGMNCDETLMAIVAGHMDIAVMPPPIPMAWLADHVAVDDTRFRLIHFVGHPQPATMAWLMENVRRRRAAAGLPPEASVPHWRKKVRRFTWKMIRYRLHTAALTRYLAFRQRMKSRPAART
ncbi:MAG: hypothetical protein KIT16_19155 [Rhodospirillaceae bacterium]|nr:hypothetical protein [Rhodospirillaceae bacterium]